DENSVDENPADEFAVIQYTSGSTSAPKGVALTADNVLAGLAAIDGGLGLTDADEIGIWSPLFHDMSLFGTLAHLARGCSVHLWRTTDFIRDTRGWLAAAAASGATVLPMPNFAYQRLVDTVEADGVPDGLDLSGWRLACNGSEPVQWSTLEAFNRVFGPCGFRPEAMLPSYGMAEATLVISLAALAERPWHLSVDRFALAPGDRAVHVTPGAACARQVVSCGTAAPGIAVRVDAPAPGRVGEIQVRGAAVMGGYLGLPAERQPFTADGWLRTGDLGFEAEDELFVVGRLKDMAVIRGQNYYAEDVEQIARRVQGFDVRVCAALQAGDGDVEHIAVLVETPLAGAAATVLVNAVEAAIAAELGPAVASVHPVPVRSIPRTSSGKVRRHAARALYRSTAEATGKP
ncbi:AMP-binding protein, partial [Frankia sp. CiP1_Cm_nod2]